MMTTKMNKHLPGDAMPKGFREIATVQLPVSSESMVVMQKERKTAMDNEPMMITYDAGKTIEARTISYLVTPRGKGSYGSMNLPGKPQERFFGAGYIDFPPIGTLECSKDGKKWKTVACLQGVEDIKT